MPYQFEIDIQQLGIHRVTVDVSPVVVPPITPNPLMVNAGADILSDQHLVTFNPVVTGGVLPLVQSWDYGDGTLGSENSHIYANNGTYLATLTVFDATINPSVSDTVQVTVNHVHSPDTPPPPEGRYYFTRHGDRIPDYCHGSTITTVKNGDALDPTVWNTGVVPGPNDRVVPNHLVSLSGSLTVHSWRTGPQGEFLVLPGARLACFTFQDHETSRLTVQGDPNNRARITIRNGSIDTVYDPEQWGHGLIISGKFQATSFRRTEYASVARAIRAGDTVLQFLIPVENWRAGDRLILPDMRQLDRSNGAGQIYGFAPYEWQGETAKVLSVSADRLTVTLTASVERDHLPVVEPDGTTPVFWPVVQNLTRDFVIESENPNGVRGHLVFVDGAEANAENAVECFELGRTTNDPVDNTTYDADGNVLHVGTNQWGRYRTHFHHCHKMQRWVGNSSYSLLEGHNFKWDLVLHGTNNSLIARNVLHNCVGSGINTEDGSERGHVIEGNYISRVHGSYGNTFTTTTGAETPAGIWLVHPDNVVRNNLVNSVAAANGVGGCGYMYFPKQLPDFGTDVPLTEFVGNVVFGAVYNGLEIWDLGYSTAGILPIPQSTVRDFRCYYQHNAMLYLYNVVNVVFESPNCCGDSEVSGEASPSTGFVGGEYVMKDITLRGAHIRGTAGCYAPGNITFGALLVEDCFFDATGANVYHGNLATGKANAEECGPRRVTYRRVRFGDLSLRKSGQQINYQLGWTEYNGNLTALDEVLVEQHNGNPADNFRIYYDEQQDHRVLHPSIPNLDFEIYGWRVKGSPEPVVLATDDFVNNGDGSYTINGVSRPGLTNAQARSLHGVSAGGEIPPAHAAAGDSKGVYGGVVVAS